MIWCETRKAMAAIVPQLCMHRHTKKQRRPAKLIHTKKTMLTFIYILFEKILIYSMQYIIMRQFQCVLEIVQPSFVSEHQVNRLAKFDEMFMYILLC